MTDKEEEMFCISIMDLHLLIDTYGAKYVMQELGNTYPDTYKAIAKLFEKQRETRKIAVLLKPKDAC